MSPSSTAAGPIAATCIRLYDAVYGDRWDSFLAVLEGVEEEQARWMPPGYTFDLVVEPDWPANGSILWQANHILACKTSYLRTVLEMDSRGADPEFTVCHCLKDVLAAAGPLHQAFRDCLATKADPEFGRAVDGDGSTLMQHLENAIRHEAWHSGQIAVVKRLYQWHLRGNPPRA